MRGAILRRARHWIANRGVRGLLAELWRRAKVWARGESRTEAERRTGEAKAVAVHPFDARYGVDTSGLVWGEALDGVDAGKSDAGYWVTGYYGVAPSVFAPALEQLGLPWEQTTFVDVGCGKGRAMLLALRFPFRRVVGVELSPELARAAEENVARFHPHWRRSEVAVEVRTGDAAEAGLPDGPLLLFLYHPFAAPVMTRFLAHVRDAAQAQPREVVLLYMNPELDGLLRRTAFLERMWDACFALSAEDREADRFASEWERMAAYRVVLPERR